VTRLLTRNVFAVANLLVSHTGGLLYVYNIYFVCQNVQRSAYACVLKDRRKAKAVKHAGDSICRFGCHVMPSWLTDRKTLVARNFKFCLPRPPQKTACGGLRPLSMARCIVDDLRFTR